MRGTRIRTLDHVRRATIAVGTEYRDGTRLGAHRHRRGQLLCGTTGVLTVSTAQGSWIMPPHRGVWIPGGVEHEVRMQGIVTMRSVYAEDPRRTMPRHCQVVAVSPLMQALLAEAVEISIDYLPGSRAETLMTLIEHELPRLPVLPLSLPWPANARLLRQCRRYLRNPNIHSRIDDWCKALDMSRRRFTRFFLKETGVSLGAWCRQACLVSALPRLVAGEAITLVASDLGYENPAAFTTMFKRAFGAAPRAYLKREVN